MAAVVIFLFHFDYFVGLGAYILLMLYGYNLYRIKGTPEKQKKAKYIYVEQNEERQNSA